jgi:hypothetical protein
MLPKTSATVRDRAIIAGHYVFSTEECRALKEEANRALLSQGVELDAYLRSQVKQSIYRYVRNFRLARSV